MVKIRFIVKEKKRLSFESELWKNKTVSQCIDNYNDWMKYAPNNQTIKIEVYVQNQLIENLNTTLGVFDSAPILCHFDDIGYFDITIKKYLIQVKELSDEAMNQPIIDYFLANDINRACWSICKKSIDINNTFNHYDTRDFIGHNEHHKKCNIGTCDLIACISDYDSYTLNSRYGLFNSMFLTDNEKIFRQRFPLICNKQSMINTFLRTIDYNELDKKIQNPIKSSELEIFCACQITRISHTNNIITENSIKKMLDGENYVLDFFRKNETALDEETGHEEYMYVFVLKSIRSNDFNSLLVNILPVVLLDIIYLYVDSEYPDISDIFNSH